MIVIWQETERLTRQISMLEKLVDDTVTAMGPGE